MIKVEVSFLFFKVDEFQIVLSLSNYVFLFLGTPVKLRSVSKLQVTPTNLVIL